jgi:translation initiation factor 3 subunit J
MRKTRKMYVLITSLPSHRNVCLNFVLKLQVLESWDAAEDSEVEREKVAKVAAAKAKADAEAAANKKSKAQRVEEHRQQNLRRRQEDEEESSSEDEDEAVKRARLKQTEQEADLKHAQDLLGDVGLGAKTRSAPRAMVSTAKGGSDELDPDASVDLGALPLFNPKTKTQFQSLSEALTPLISGLHKNGHYSLFVQEFAKNLVRDLPSTEVKKIATALSTLSNEKLKEEKAAEKGGKKTKAAKTKSSLVATRDVSHKADVSTYDEDLAE